MLAPRLLLVPLALLLAPACGGPSEDNFMEKYSRLACDLSFECDPVAAEAYFDSEGDCRDYVEEAFDATAALRETCVYDPEQADACLDGVRDADCDSFSDPPACDRVWTECEL